MAASPREQVFISSTFTDLIAERQAVTRALLQAKAFPAGMELFPAADSNSWVVIERAIDDSDYYLLIIGARYGSLDPEQQVSFTEREYAYAKDTNKPIVAFMHSDPGSIAANKTDQNSELAGRLEAFKGRVRAERQVATWTSAAELAGQVVLALNELRQSNPAVGWVRGDQAMTEAERAQVAELKAELAETSLRAASLEEMLTPRDLAQGADLFKLQGTVIARLPNQSGEMDSFSQRWSLEQTWDSIFRRLAPLLMSGQSRHELMSNLSDWIAGRGWIESDPDEGDLPDEVQLIGWELDDDSLMNVLLQFDALELVESQDGNRWHISPRGRVYLRSTAFRRGSPSGQRSST
jgi:Domain of unknown function (DUF4062)